MNEVTRYSDMQIVDSFTRFRMAIKGNTVPDTEMWVREIDYDALRVDYLNAVQGRDIAINERDEARKDRNAAWVERDAAKAECARLTAERDQLSVAWDNERTANKLAFASNLSLTIKCDALRAELVRISKGTVP